MSLKKLSCCIAAGLGLLAVVVLAVLSIGVAAELEDMRQGVLEGFELEGTYLEPGQNSGRSLSFVEDQGDQERLSWQARDEAGARASGHVEKTPDPNLYVLIDSDGNEVGWVHLAYSNGKAEGTLFVKYGTRDIAELSKYSRNPMIEERPAE
ncbi:MULTISPECIES: hypothetical protein [unclassified Adlercreutzia]|uniref:hypothetical protein n=1 Tax=unclassified Adlercreutzia TaxID=2636013 RepID=UPI0013EC5512|nr:MULTISPECIES: hypothetical protein [unclassified Adlercreutzia]